jgi:hypothetical protein
MAQQEISTQDSSGQKKRFGGVTLEEVPEKRRMGVPETTRKADKQAAKAFRLYLREKGECEDFENFSKEKLDEVLQTFYFNARQVNGQDYKTNSLETFRYGLNRYLRDDNNMPIDLINMPEFTMSNRNYKTAMNSLKAAGLGYTKHHEPLARDDLMKLYDIKYLNPQTAEGLARKVQFDIRFYMCRRGSENIYDMKKEASNMTQI